MPTADPKPATTRGRPRKVDAEQRRDGILAHALDEFSLHGFSGTSIDSIARRARVSKMTIYKYFGDKEGLFRALGRQVTAPVQRRVDDVVSAGRPVAAVLTDFARALRYQENDDEGFGLLRLAVFEQHRFPAIAEAIYQSGFDAITPLVDYMGRLIAAGTIEAKDAEEATVHFCALVTRGHRFLLVEDEDDEAQERYLTRAVDIFLRGLRAPAAIAEGH